MNELETKANAMLSELTAQRNMAFDRCANAMGELAVLRAKFSDPEVLRAKLAELEAQLKAKEPSGDVR